MELWVQVVIGALATAVQKTRVGTGGTSPDHWDQDVRQDCILPNDPVPHSKFEKTPKKEILRHYSFRQNVTKLLLEGDKTREPFSQIILTIESPSARNGPPFPAHIINYYNSYLTFSYIPQGPRKLDNLDLFRNPFLGEWYDGMPMSIYWMKLGLTEFWEDLPSSLHRGPPGFWSTKDGFKNCADGSNWRLRKGCWKEGKVLPWTLSLILYRVPSQTTLKDALQQAVTSDSDFLRCHSCLWMQMMLDNGEDPS